MSRKQIAGGRGTVIISPASVRVFSKPPMIFAVHDCACCACQMASTASSCAFLSVSVSGEKEVAPSSMTVAPLASIGSIRSDHHASDCVAATRRRLSPKTRRVRSIDRGLKAHRELDLDERDDRKLILSHPIILGGRRSTSRLADEDKQVQRDARPPAQFIERFVAKRRESLVGGRVHEP